MSAPQHYQRSQLIEAEAVTFLFPFYRWEKWFAPIHTASSQLGLDCKPSAFPTTLKKTRARWQEMVKIRCPAPPHAPSALQDLSISATASPETADNHATLISAASWSCPSHVGPDWLKAPGDTGARLTALPAGGKVHWVFVSRRTNVHILPSRDIFLLLKLYNHSPKHQPVWH